MNRIPRDSYVKIAFYHKIREGKISECDLIVTDEQDWDTRPEASDPAWSVVRAGGNVYALSVLI
jgi:hypothetical protein